MPIVDNTSRFSGAGSPAAAHEARATDPAKSGKEVMLMAGHNAASPAKVFEAKIAQEGSH
jgi:hypothetical protein